MLPATLVSSPESSPSLPLSTPMVFEVHKHCAIQVLAMAQGPARREFIGNPVPSLSLAGSYGKETMLLL